MSSIGVLGLGNWGTALAHIWGQDGHNVNGWTIEQEVYESIVMDSVNSKYLPDTPLSGIDVTMDLADICATSEVLVLALPSSVILEVVDQIIPHLRPSHVLLDLAKGIAPEEEGGSGLISEAIEARLGVPPQRAVNLLGLTELASQFYDGVLAQGAASPRRKQGAPWTRTTVVAPDTVAPVEHGERGLLVHVDLANLERPAFVRTDDLGVADADGFHVLGRASGAESRGCSLSVEELLG